MRDITVLYFFKSQAGRSHSTTVFADHGPYAEAFHRQFSGQLQADLE